MPRNRIWLQTWREHGGIVAGELWTIRILVILGIIVLGIGSVLITTPDTATAYAEYFTMWSTSHSSVVDRTNSNDWAGTIQVLLRDQFNDYTDFSIDIASVDATLCESNGVLYSWPIGYTFFYERSEGSGWQGRTVHFRLQEGCSSFGTICWKWDETNQQITGFLCNRSSLKANYGHVVINGYYRYLEHDTLPRRANVVLHEMGHIVGMAHATLFGDPGSGNIGCYPTVMWGLFCSSINSETIYDSLQQDDIDYVNDNY